jgi:NAD(P)-dependent dehydrogenase (short-subunit alcohol dehydrogenase family)
VSKFAVEGLTQVWAAELEGTEPVRINCINPGATRTNMRCQAYPAENPEYLKTPEDIMPAYIYLMGKDSRLINGRSIDAQIKVAAD